MKIDGVGSSLYTMAGIHKVNSSVSGTDGNPTISHINNATGGIASYDFRNMTPRQLQGTMNDLIKSGKMSLDESSALVGMIPTALSKVNYDGQTPTEYEQPSNFIARLQDGIEFAKSRNDVANMESFTKALDALQKLQGIVMGVDIHA